MEWGVFEDISQFRVEDALVVDEIAIENEEMGEPSSPIIFAENELLIAEGVVTIMEEEMVETNVEHPSTSFQRESTSSKRKGKELEGINVEDEPMVQPQEIQVSLVAKRRRPKRKTPIAKLQVETIPAATPKVYARRTRSTTQKVCLVSDATQIISVEASEEESPIEVEIQKEDDVERLSRLAYVAGQLEEHVE